MKQAKMESMTTVRRYQNSPQIQQIFDALYFKAFV